MPLRAALAASTRPAHESLERLMGLERAPSPGRYACYLLAMHAVVEVFEREISSDSRLERLGLQLAARRKLPWLEADLRDLGITPRRIACAEDVPPDVPRRVGWAYVLEGSTLGGRAMLQDLAPRLGFTGAHGAAFLAGYGTRTGEMWRTFVGALDAIPFDDRETKACAAGAMQAFEVIGEVFRDVSVARADARLDRQPGGGLAA